MEALSLVSLLLGIVVIGYVAVKIALSLVGTVLGVAGNNRLIVLVIGVIVLVMWFRYHH